jgi:probable HAF family extracellular repeat protein
MTDLGTLTGYNESEAYAINDKGWVVGGAKNGTVEHAVLWKPK